MLDENQIVGDGRYMLKRYLGEGGMGIVWLAQDNHLREEVALKFLPSQLRLDASALADLRTETQRSRKLTHPNIIRIHDLSEREGEDPFISMEYVDGPTLSKLRVQLPERIMGWERLSDLMRQFCEALEYAHNERVIHRDVKPSNLMVDSRGRLKLADFGIARVVTDSLSRVTLRQGTSGTLVYMSPQQLDGRPPNPTDDIYSAGATLYELLTSKPPFHTGDITHQVRYVEATPMSQRLEELRLSNAVPKNVEETVAACLKKNPSERPPNARALGATLGLLEFKPPSTKPSTRRQPPPPPPPPRDWRKWALRAVIILAVLGLVVAAVYWAKNAVDHKEAAAWGSLKVTITPSDAVDDGAVWQLGDGSTHQSGSVVTNLQPGSHVVLFSQISGWTAPRSFLVTVIAGQVQEVKQSYERSTSVNPSISTPRLASLSVAIAPNEAINAGAVWSFDGGPPSKSGALVTNISPGDHVVAFRAIPGWKAPEERVVTLIADQTTNINGFYQLTRPAPPAGKPYPHAGSDWTNSLAMRFSPLPGTSNLMSIWDTRVSDYRTFVKSQNFTNDAQWKNPAFASNEDDPVVNVNYTDALQFCTWLTEVELGKGSLGPKQFYRLPKDKEWSAAVGGLEAESGDNPKERNETVPEVYPWGKWPPAAGAGNLPGSEVDLDIDKIDGYQDSYPRLAPVGHFSRNPYGFYDMSGNVQQWCSDAFSPTDSAQVLRGSSWETADKFELLSSHRGKLGADYRNRHVGFRCVLDTGEPNGPARADH